MSNSCLNRRRPTMLHGRNQFPSFHMGKIIIGLDVGHRSSVISLAVDYTASSTDSTVLQQNPRTELLPDEIENVFGWPRDLEAEYLVGKVLGAGSFGVVREVIEKKTGQRFAVKSIPKTPKRGLSSPRYLLKLRTEAEIMEQLGFSLDAVCLKACFEDKKQVHLVMDLAEGGTLFERIESNVYGERYIRGIVRSILRFISQCHAKGIIYRDVKPDNFLFESNKIDANLKATDFGLAIRHWPEEPKLTSRSGTPAFMAPELVTQQYDCKCDVWSLGMVAYQLLTGHLPFWEDVRKESLSDVWKAILTEEINWNKPELTCLSPSAQDFLKALLQKDPKMRVSAHDALHLPWLVEEGVNAMEEVPEGTLEGSVVQRLQRWSTFGHLKQLVLRIITEDIILELPESKDRGSENLLSKLQELFDTLDADHSGQLTIDEISKGLVSLGYSLSESEVERLMRKIDADHDGGVDLKEFITSLLDWETLTHSSKWQRYVDHAFSLLDDKKVRAMTPLSKNNLLTITCFTGFLQTG